MTTLLSDPEEEFTRSPSATLEKLQDLYGPDNVERILRYIPDLEAFADHIDELIESGDRLQVALFWGPHPERNKPNAADKKTLKAVFSMFDGIIDTDTTIIIADYHGRKNGIENDAYLAGIRNYVDVLSAGEQGKTIRAISLDDLYAMFDIPEPEAVPVTDLDPYVLEKLEIAASHHPTRAEPEVYVAMRRNELPTIDVVLSFEGKGLLLAITEPDEEVMKAVFHGLENRLAVIRGANKSGAAMSNTPPWILHRGTSGADSQIRPESVSSADAAAERGLVHGY